MTKQLDKQSSSITVVKLCLTVMAFILLSLITAAHQEAWLQVQTVAVGVSLKKPDIRTHT